MWRSSITLDGRTGLRSDPAAGLFLLRSKQLQLMLEVKSFCSESGSDNMREEIWIDFQQNHQNQNQWSRSRASLVHQLLQLKAAQIRVLVPGSGSRFWLSPERLYPAASRSEPAAAGWVRTRTSLCCWFMNRRKKISSNLKH